MIQEATQIILEGNNLSQEKMQAVMEEIMTANADTPDIVSFLTALSNKGETVEELTAAVRVMRKHAIKIHSQAEVILDTCGTGGDKKGTFNVSTLVAIIASSCGITVAKHGNRSVSSRSGSADILEALGINIDIPPDKIEACLNDIGIAFLFAQKLHPAMKYAMPARKQIGSRTMFNILGPLTNPAGANHQLLGVYDKRWVEILSVVLGQLGTKHAIVVCGEDGLDEITLTDKTFVSEISQSGIRSYSLCPEDFGFSKARLEDLSGGSAVDNSRIMLDVLNGKVGPQRDMVLLNAGAAIYVADKAGSISEGIKLARASLDSKKPLEKLELLRRYTNK